ncbi:MAG: efflux RND transporter permease subunit [Micavibrio sp.]|nr:efflux RND transporter permease subunit [Micavibrio sp.]
MNISEFCIRRPVFTILLMAALLVGGLSGYMQLPVSALPRVDFPTISVSASLSGASPETMASTVATPLERQFSTIPGVTSMTSSSTLGSTRVTLQFDLARDIDGAALDVQTAISTAQRQLPKEMTTPPSFRKTNPADAPVLLIAVSSASLPISQVDDYADTMIGQRLSTVTGVAQVQIYGEQKYAVRIKVDPDKLAAQNLSFDDVSTAVSNAASNTPVGIINGPNQLFNLNFAGQPQNAAAFSNLVAVWKDGAPVRLKDIATVTDGVQDDHSMATIDGKSAVVLAIQRQPDANTIDVVKRVRDLLPMFQQQLPPSVEITPLMDRAVAVHDAVHDVQFTLLLTIGLVIGVIFLFLRDLRATLIPAIAVPLSIISTYGVMSLLNYSIDNISLLALTLCVGFVVDDAIVMLENIVRHMEDGMKPFEAALKGAKEISFTIISITFSLVAVFIPILFMGGMVGRILQEFAVTISIAILSSGLISLTLTPMLCSKILHAQHHTETRAWAQKLEAAFEYLLGGYDRSLKWCLHHRRTMLAVTLLSLLISIAAFAVMPKGLFPLEDTGFLSGTAEAAQDISYNAMLEKQARVAGIIRANKAVKHVFYTVGGSNGAYNTSRISVSLQPKGQRPDAPAVMAELKKQVAKVEGINVFFQSVQNIQVGGRSAKSLYQYTLQDNNLTELYAWSAKLEEALGKTRGFADVTTDLQLKSLQAVVTPDQDKASSVGLSNGSLREALYSAFGSLQIGSIYTPSDDYEIIMDVEDDFKKSPEDIKKLYLRGSGERLTPLDAVASVTRTLGPLSVNHQGQMPSVTLSFNLSDGMSLSTAVDSIASVQKKIAMPASITGTFQGNAQVFQDAANGQGMLIGVTLVVIYIILGMLYESFIHPITILSGLPSAGIGAALSLLLMGMDLSVIAIVGIILLIGIVKKNAIMMVDFAITQRAEGKGPEEAIYQACLLRFRPIFMTSLAAIFGSLPIAIAFGAGAELRQPLGVTVVGGLLTSQLLTLYITPVIYMYLEEWRERRLHKSTPPVTAA